MTVVECVLTKARSEKIPARRRRYGRTQKGLADCNALAHRLPFPRPPHIAHRPNTRLTLAQGNPTDREARAGAHESNFSIWQARAGQDRCGSFGDGRRRCPREPRAPQGPALIIAHYRTCPPTAEKTLSQMHSIAQNILQSFSLLIGSRKASWHITLCDYLSTFFLIENLYECRFAGRRGLGCTDSTRAPRAGPMLRCKSHSPASKEHSHLSVIAKCVRSRATDRPWQGKGKSARTGD